MDWTSISNTLGRPIMPFGAIDVGQAVVGLGPPEIEQ